MPARPLHSALLLRSLYGTEPFVAYCRERSIAFEQTASGALHPENLRRWEGALALLPADRRAQVQAELGRVFELADRDGVAHLLSALDGKELPPGHIPDGAAVALWVLRRHADTFRDVFLHHETCAGTPWRTVRVPRGLRLGDAQAKAGALAASLKEFFRLLDGTGRFCVTEVHPFGGATCFVAHIADRPRLLEGFTDSGRQMRRRLRPSVLLAFVYSPAEGIVFLRSPLRSRDANLSLARGFGRAVLGIELAERCMVRAFDLDVLKREFRPLPDADDMESVRVKALHLRYPARSGRRRLTLETLPGDDPSAIGQMLKAHLPGDSDLERLEVCYAELQVSLRVEGGMKAYPIRLWRDRCDLGRTALDERFYHALKSWGLYRAW